MQNYEEVCNGAVTSYWGIHTTYSWNIKWEKCADMNRNGFYLKKLIKIEILKQKNPGSRLEVAC